MMTDGISIDDAGSRLLWFQTGIIFEKSWNVCVHVNPWRSADARPHFHTWSDGVSILVGSFFEIFHASQTRCVRGIWAFFRGEISCREYIWHLCFFSPFCLGDKWQNIFTFFPAWNLSLPLTFTYCGQRFLQILVTHCTGLITLTDVYQRVMHQLLASIKHRILLSKALSLSVCELYSGEKSWVYQRSSQSVCETKLK